MELALYSLLALAPIVTIFLLLVIARNMTNLVGDVFANAPQPHFTESVSVGSGFADRSLRPFCDYDNGIMATQEFSHSVNFCADLFN